MSTYEFKQDLEALLDEYGDIDDDRLRNAAYQVIDYYGEGNMARKYRNDSDDEEEDDEEDNEDEVIPSTDEEHSKTPSELRG